MYQNFRKRAKTRNFEISSKRNLANVEMAALADKVHKQENQLIQQHCCTSHNATVPIQVAVAQLENTNIRCYNVELVV